MQNRTIKIVDDSISWNNFVKDNTQETFHQSWEWGQVFIQKNHKVWYVGVFDEHNQLITTCLTIKVVAKRGTFLLVPHGPIFNEQTEISDVLKDLKDYLVHLARVENCAFIRVAPISKRTPENDILYYENGFKDAPIFVQSEESFVLNLEPSLDELLKNMRKSTRYILRNQDKFGITCERTTSLEAIDLFCKLYTETVSNQGFFGQSTDFITQEYKTFLNSQSVGLYFARYNNQVVAAAFIIEQHGGGFYHYGASIRSDSSVPAPHVLQWFIINNLKERGFKQYNFWGIAPENKPHHRF
jgi:lipid II:glycine glycyltransferase (peptidoglycan interpeptide bridge formation enzyme)